MKFSLSLAFCGLLSLSVSPAWATDWYTGSSRPEVGDFGSSVDASLSITSQGDRHAAFIGTISPFSKLEQSGLRFGIGGDLGEYNYRSSAPGVGVVTGREEEGDLSIGWVWAWRRATLALRVGADVRNDQLDKVDPTGARSGTEAGLKIDAEVYANPTVDTMTFAQASYSSVRKSFYVHGKWGWAIARDVFVGPEALLLGDQFYEQWRVGAHVSGVRLGRLQFGLAGGFLRDRSRGSGAYGTLDLRLAF